MLPNETRINQIRALIHTIKINKLYKKVVGQYHEEGLKRSLESETILHEFISDKNLIYKI